MVTCAVPGCSSGRKENPQNYTFHIFPKNIEVHQKWLKMVNRKDWVPKKNSTICSKHFEGQCFSPRSAKRTKLLPDSIPTLYMPIKLKPTRKVSSYVYRDISPLPSTSATNFPFLDNGPRKQKMQSTINTLKRRLNIKQKKIQKLRAQKKRALEKVVKLSQIIKKLESSITKPGDKQEAMDTIRTEANECDRAMGNEDRNCNRNVIRWVYFISPWHYKAAGPPHEQQIKQEPM